MDTEYYSDATKEQVNKTSDGIEYWTDENDKISHIKYFDGSEKWWDEDGNLIHAIYPDGGPQETYDKWDSDGNPTHGKYSDGTEVWWEDGKVVHYKAEDGSECGFDKNDMIIHRKDANGIILKRYNVKKKTVIEDLSALKEFLHIEDSDLFYPF